MVVVRTLVVVVDDCSEAAFVVMVVGISVLVKIAVS